MSSVLKKTNPPFHFVRPFVQSNNLHNLKFVYILTAPHQEKPTNNSILSLISKLQVGLHDESPRPLRTNFTHCVTVLFYFRRRYVIKSVEWCSSGCGAMDRNTISRLNI